MLYVYLGTDRKKARDAMNASIKKTGKNNARVQITDAHSIADLNAALAGPGLFGDERTVVLDGVFTNEELREHVIAALASMKDSADAFFLFEDKFDAATKRSVTKYAEAVETFDAPKKAPDNGIFALRYALEKGDKKTLWVGLMREYAAGKAPEAVHGFLFWAAKQMVLSARSTTAARSRKILARLAELPHESRRKGVELEYALERFVLSEV
jgi:DNA polymerase III delta subunit